MEDKIKTSIENPDGTYNVFKGLGTTHYCSDGQQVAQCMYSKEFRKIKVKRLSPNAIIPTRGTKGAAGYDLFANDEVTILPGTRACVQTGISMSIPVTYYGRVAPRSGLAVKHGIDVLAGVIDSDYTGNIGVVLINHGTGNFTVKVGDKIAQIIFEKIGLFDLIETTELETTERGSGGFGSTDKKN